nr:hypothetical protein [Tanacetum cinerariifolium]
MFEDKSYEAHEDHKKLYDALENSLEHDYSDQLLSYLEEARQKKRKRRDIPRTPSGLPPPQPPPLPPPAGASGAPSTSGASGSSQFPPPPPPLSHPSTGTSKSALQQGSKASNLSKTQELSPTDSLIQYDSISNEQVHFSDDEDSKNDHLAKADSRKDWWKPLPEEERPTTPKLSWTIPSSTISDVENNWATALVLAYETLAENSLLAKTRDMMNFLNCPALSISKMKAASYPVFGLELLVLKQMWIDDMYMLLRRVKKKLDQTCRFLVSLELKPTQDMGYEFKYDYTIIESPRAVVFLVNNNERKIMRFNEIYKFSDGTLTRILEALAYIVKEFNIKRLNLGTPSSMSQTISNIDAHVEGEQFHESKN